jgi:hypothetical protein
MSATPTDPDRTSPSKEVVRLLEAVLAPIEPPASLAVELELHLADVQSAAIEALEELSDWEAGAFRDPRNWVRPAAAIAIGTAAGTALVLLRMRQARKRPSGLRGLAEQSGKELAQAVAPLRAKLR